MSKNTLILIFSICMVILSAIILAVGPITNKKIGANWGYLNCGLIDDQKDSLSYDSEKLKDMRNLCRRQSVMYNMEYCAFIINIVAGIICADLAILQHMGIAKDFEIQTGVIASVGGLIGFVLTLVYVCYSGYIFTKDTAYLEINFNYGNLDYIESKAILKLYSNGASAEWDGKKFVTKYEDDEDYYDRFIKYKDLGKSRYNYDSDYYKKYLGYIEATGEIFNCQETKYNLNSSCKYLYHEPTEENTNLDLYNRWLTAIILACFVLLCTLFLVLMGVFSFTNFGIGFLN